MATWVSQSSWRPVYSRPGVAGALDLRALSQGAWWHRGLQRQYDRRTSLDSWLQQRVSKRRSLTFVIGFKDACSTVLSWETSELL